MQPGAYYDDSYFYVNVWGYDARWGDVRYTDSGKQGEKMARLAAYDGNFVQMGRLLQLRSGQGDVRTFQNDSYLPHPPHGGCDLCDGRRDRPFRRTLYDYVGVVTNLKI